MASYTEWDRLVGLFRKNSPNIAKAFDEAKKHSIRQDDELTALSAAQPTPGRTGQSWTNGWGTFSSGSGLPGANWRPYSDASWINTPLPPNPTLVSNSQAMVDQILANGVFKSIRPNSSVANDYQHPYFFSTGSDPLFTVNGTRSASPDGVQLRIPAIAAPSGGSDGHLTICDQTSGLIHDFFEFPQSRPGGGGTIDVGLQGYSLVSSYGGHHPSGADVDYIGYANAAAAGNLAGMIRFQELSAGRIDHALFLVSGATNGQQVYPARSYGTGSGANQPPTGQWIYLNMTWAEIDALTDVAGWQKTIYKAFSKYGGWVGDQGAGPSLQMHCEGVTTWSGITNPWIAWCDAQRLLANHHIDLDTGVYYPNVFDAPSINWSTKLKCVHPDVIQF